MIIIKSRFRLYIKSVYVVIDISVRNKRIAFYYNNARARYRGTSVRNIWYDNSNYYCFGNSNVTVKTSKTSIEINIDSEYINKISSDKKEELEKKILEFLCNNL